MEKFIINPENYQSEYIKNLNECFNGWGGDREYDWVFERKVGEHSSDILLIKNEEDGVIAGSGVSYRRLSGKGKSIDIGIMTGSWTLPAARRKGCFTKMINCSKDLCEKRDVPYLTAFVTETNPSARRLKAEGSYMIPSYHLFSPNEPFEDVAEVVEAAGGEDAHRAVFDTFQRRQRDFLNFSYTFEEFKGQYILRIKQTTILQIEDDYAILEDGNNEVKVLVMTYSNDDSLERNMKAVTNWCLEKRRKKAFFFSTRKNFYRIATTAGFENLSGFFTVLRTDEQEISFEENFEDININMADKM